MKRWLLTRRLLTSCAVLGLAGAAAIWSGWRLWALAPLPAVVGHVGVSFSAQPAASPGTAPSLLRKAVAADPFRRDREPAPVAFRLPGSSQPEAKRALPQVVLVGTALLPEGKSFAMCRFGNDPPKVVRLGDEVDGYVLKLVEQGRAVFQSGSGDTLEVRVPKAGG